MPARAALRWRGRVQQLDGGIGQDRIAVAVVGKRHTVVHRDQLAAAVVPGQARRHQRHQMQVVVERGSDLGPQQRQAVVVSGRELVRPVEEGIEHRPRFFGAAGAGEQAGAVVGDAQVGRRCSIGLRRRQLSASVDERLAAGEVRVGGEQGRDQPRPPWRVAPLPSRHLPGPSSQLAKTATGSWRGRAGPERRAVSSTFWGATVTLDAHHGGPSCRPWQLEGLQPGARLHGFLGEDQSAGQDRDFDLVRVDEAQHLRSFPCP